MNKIPVLPTIKAAYHFVFTHLGSIIGLIWLPMVLITVAAFFVEQRYFDAAANALASSNPGDLGSETLGLICFFIAWLLFLAIMYVPVVQLALGQRKGGAVLHFAFGPIEWRLFRAVMGLTGLLLAPILLVGFLINGLLYTGMGGHGVSPQVMLAGLELLVVLAYLGIAYVGLRFLFLLPAVAVTGEGSALPRAWKLSAGNFWRILLIVLATILPVGLIATLVQIALEGSAATVPVLSNSTAVLAVQLHNMAVNMPLTQGIGFLVAPLLLGLAAGGSAAAWQSLQGNDKSVTDI